MVDLYKYPPKSPRTIDVLKITDCIEIIVNDLARYGVPEKLAIELIMEYFLPLKKITDNLKDEYGKICFKDTPDFVFDTK